jgi:molecular chaperone DnaK (HSP70)
MKGLHNLFVEHYIDIPDQKVDVVEELAAKVEHLQGELNEQIEKSKEYKKELKEQKKSMAVQTACEGLTQTQAEKLKSLAESVKFTSEEEFAQKLEQLKEAYAPTAQVKAADKSVLEEGVDVEEQKVVKASHDPLIDAVAKSISKSVVK